MSTAAKPDGPVVVVAYDGSAPARAAARYAADRAGTTGRVIVVHASEPFSGNGDAMDVREHTTRGQAVLDDLLMTDGECLLDLDFDVQLIGGDPAKAVLSVAELNDADEIATGTRGEGRLTSALIGSVSRDLIHAADRPVVVIPA
jgi:nucleotide-binding universal stress UspA family protein